MKQWPCRRPPNGIHMNVHRAIELKSNGSSKRIKKKNNSRKPCDVNSNYSDKTEDNLLSSNSLDDATCCETLVKRAIKENNFMLICEILIKYRNIPENCILDLITLVLNMDEGELYQQLADSDYFKLLTKWNINNNGKSTWTKLVSGKNGKMKFSNQTKSIKNDKAKSTKSSKKKNNKSRLLNGGHSAHISQEEHMEVEEQTSTSPYREGM